MSSIYIEQKWAHDLKQKLPKYIERGDTLNLWGLPLLGKYEQLQRICSSISSNIRFAFIDAKTLIDVNTEEFFTILNSQLDKREERNIMIRNVPAHIVTDKILNLVTPHSRICIVINSLERLIPLGENFFNAFRGIRDKYPGSVCYIFITEKPLHEHPVFKNNTEFLILGLQNQVVAKPLSKEETHKMVQKLAEEFAIKMGQKEQKKLEELSGGIVGLLKPMLRAMEANTKDVLDAEVLQKDPATKIRLEKICQTFSIQEQIYLNKTANNKHLKPMKTDYMQKTGIIVGGKIRSLLLNTYMKTHPANINEIMGEAKEKDQQELEKADLRIDVNTGEIYRGPKRLLKVLSDEELTVSKLLLENDEKITSREEIAKRLWGNQYPERYSDWAIDKIVSRIRKKILDSDKPHKYLMTMKGKGFKLNLTLASPSEIQSES